MKNRKPGPEIEQMENGPLVTAADVFFVNTSAECEICAHLQANAHKPPRPRMVTKALVWRGFCGNGHDCLRGGMHMLACGPHALEIMRSGLECPSCDDHQIKPYHHMFERTITL